MSQSGNLRLEMAGIFLLKEQVVDKHTAEMNKPHLSFWNALLAKSGLLAYMPIIMVVILMFCGASWQIF